MCVQVLVDALKLWPRAPAVAHAALQCLVALCKDNAMMKAHVTATALPSALAALRQHAGCPHVVERAFTLLGVLQVRLAMRPTFEHLKTVLTSHDLLIVALTDAARRQQSKCRPSRPLRCHVCCMRVMTTCSTPSSSCNLDLPPLITSSPSNPTWQVPVIWNSATDQCTALQAGGDHLNDGIRRLQVEAGLLPLAVPAIARHARAQDEPALAAACFAVAMVLRGGERWRRRIKARAARTPLLPALRGADQVCIHLHLLLRGVACSVSNALSYKQLRRRDRAHATLLLMAPRHTWSS